MPDSIALPVKLTVMMLIAALCLGLTNMVTQEPIAKQEALQAEALRLEVLPDANSFAPIQVPGAKDTLLAAYAAEGTGYVFEMSVNGFGGAMGVTVGILEDGTVSGVRIGTHSETPGLGTKAADESFYGQFAGQGTKATLSVVKSVPKEGEIQAITAATVSSGAVTGAVNDAIECYNAVAGGAK